MDTKISPRRLLRNALWMLLMAVAGIPNGWAQEPGTLGAYHGLVTRTSEPPPWSNAHVGARFELSVAANGSYTGKIISTGTPLSFSGNITSTDVGAGTSSTTIPRGGLPALGLELDFSNDAVAGTITHPDGETASITGWRRVWDSTARPATNYLGRYNFYLITSLGEVGCGIGSFSVAANGDVTVSGKLPDGSVFKTVTFLGPDGEVMIYQTLPYGKIGSILGSLRLTPAGDDILPSLSAGNVAVSWFKPAQTLASDRFFKDGFTIDCDVNGGIYIAPAPGDIAAGLLDVSANGAIVFEGMAAGSETPANTFFTLTSANKLTMAAAAFNPAKTTLTVKPATGEFSGGFTLVDHDYNQQTGTDRDGNPIFKKLTRKVKFEGIIVDNGTNSMSSGFYLTGTNPDPSAEPPTTLSTSPLTGGTVSLQQNPEAPPALYVGFDNASLDPTEGEDAALFIYTSEPLSEARTFTVTAVPDTATAADLSATSIKVTIPAGFDHAVVPVPVKDDGLDEDDEVFHLRLADGPGFDLNEAAVCEVTIVDDDYPVEITGDPQSQIMALGSSGGFRVESEGSDLQFLWQRNGSDLPGVTGNPVAFKNVQLSQAGLYRAKVSNAINTAFSNAAELAVVDTGVKLVSQAPGNQAVLTASVAGPPGTLSYQWMLSGRLVENDVGATPRITGATTPVLTLRSLSSADIGDYVCVVQQTSSGLEMSTGEYRLRLPTLKPSIADVELPEGQILRPYYYETLFDTDFEAAPGSFSATGLPVGLSIDPNTGIISGIPTAAVANVTVTITATNLVGSTSVQSLLTVLPFPAAALGTFHGVVDRVNLADPVFEPTPWPRAEMGARIELQTTATGGFSGKLLNGSTFPFSGQLSFDDTGVLSGKTTIDQTMNGLPPLHLYVIFDLEKQTFSGLLGNQDPTSVPDPFDPLPIPGTFVSVWGWRNAWSQAKPATAYLGRYNFTLGSDGAGDPFFTPEGTGFGTFVSIASGTFNITGMMPDGTTFICNTFLGPDGQVLLYQPLFKNPGSLHGAIQVNLQVDDGSSGNPPGLDPLPPSITLIQSTFETSPEGLRCSWNKPYQTNPKDKLYRAGFPTAYLIVDGGLYTPPEAGAIVMNLPDVPLNAELQFYSGTAGSDFPSQDVTMTSTGKATVPTGVDNPMKLTFTVNAATGQFNGAFTKLDEDPNRPPLYNDVTGKLIRPQGYFTRSGRYYGIIINSTVLGGGPEMSIGSGLFTLPQLPTTDTDPPVTAANAQTISGRLSFMRNPEAPEPLSISFSAGGYISHSEAEAGMIITIPVNMSQPQSSRRTIPLSIQHRTTSSADFTISSNSVVFEPDQTEAYVFLSIVNDNLDEVDEVFYLKLADGPGYNLYGGRQAVVIMDDDTAVQIIRDPFDQLTATGGSISLDVEVEGSDPFTFQWRRDGVAIPGAVQQNLTIENAKLSDGGRYDVVVTNRVGSVTSATADVAVMDSNERFFPVAAGGNASLSLNINAPPGSVTFQWISAMTGTPVSDDARITGSTTKTLTISNVTVDDEGDYVCVVTQPSPDILMPGMELQSAVQHLIIVSEKPALLALPALTGAVAAPFSHQVEFEPESYRRPASFSATNLPAGLNIDAVTGLISGSPSAAVIDRVITITATNAGGTDSVNTTITIDPLPAGIIGTFQGYVDRNFGEQISDAPPEFLPPWTDAELGGLIEITTLPTGSLTGKLTYAGNVHGFTGAVTQDEGAGIYANALIPRSGKQSLFLSFQIDPFSADMIIGQIDVSNMSISPVQMQAWRQVWSAGTPATAYAGNYAFAISSDAGFSEFSPGGAGFATCTVPLNGAPFEIKGRLPDGTAFVCSSLLGPRGEFIIYQGLYARLGSVLAPQRLAAEPDAAAGEPVYVEASGPSTLFKPSQTSASETIYRSGIGPVGLIFEGGRAVVTPPTSVVMGLQDGNDNAMLNFMNANVESSATPPSTIFRIRPGGATNMKSGIDNPAKVTLTVKPATSEFSGTFLLSDPNPLNPSSSISRSSSFQGIFIELPDGTQTGRGYFTLKQLPEPGVTTVSTAPSYTGFVEIQPGPGVP